MSAIVEIREMEGTEEELENAGYRIVLTKERDKKIYAAIKPQYYTCWIKRDIERMLGKLGNNINLKIISVFNDPNGAKEELEKPSYRQTTLF